ncbi:hypothetical protein FOA52_011543 [Chlamydomonas sp. UWO 241]|nr:hypothetical protein FOA52_011543 [Chlamydomonas sp. UWO 241]
MMKLLGRVSAPRPAKATSQHPLLGKTVQIGAHSMRAESVLGEGGLATVYRAVDTSSGETFAVKHMRLADKAAMADMWTEAQTLTLLQGHPNIVRLVAAAVSGPEGVETDGYMLLEYCPTTLLSVLQACEWQLDEPTALSVFADMCAAVAHMHAASPPIAHRDLKAENVLRAQDGRWVLCDFGSATTRAQVYETTEERATEEETIRRNTTPAYRAPEMWDLYARQRIDTKVDVWALGVLLAVLLSGKLPFGDQKLAVLNGRYDPPTNRSPASVALLRTMLVADPSERPDMASVRAQLARARGVPAGSSNGGGCGHGEPAGRGGQAQAQASASQAQARPQAQAQARPQAAAPQAQSRPQAQAQAQAPSGAETLAVPAAFSADWGDVPAFSTTAGAGAQSQPQFSSREHAQGAAAVAAAAAAAAVPEWGDDQAMWRAAAPRAAASSNDFCDAPAFASAPGLLATAGTAAAAPARGLAAAGGAPPQAAATVKAAAPRAAGGSSNGLGGLGGAPALAARGSSSAGGAPRAAAGGNALSDAFASPFEASSTSARRAVVVGGRSGGSGSILATAAAAPAAAAPPGPQNVESTTGSRAAAAPLPARAESRKQDKAVAPSPAPGPEEAAGQAGGTGGGGDRAASPPLPTSASAPEAPPCRTLSAKESFEADWGDAPAFELEAEDGGGGEGGAAVAANAAASGAAVAVGSAPGKAEVQPRNAAQAQATAAGDSGDWGDKPAFVPAPAPQPQPQPQPRLQPQPQSQLWQNAAAYRGTAAQSAPAGGLSAAAAPTTSQASSASAGSLLTGPAQRGSAARPGGGGQAATSAALDSAPSRGRSVNGGAVLTANAPPTHAHALPAPAVGGLEARFTQLQAAYSALQAHAASLEAIVTQQQGTIEQQRKILQALKDEREAVPGR